MYLTSYDVLILILYYFFILFYLFILVSGWSPVQPIHLKGPIPSIIVFLFIMSIKRICPVQLILILRFAFSSRCKKATYYQMM